MQEGGGGGAAAGCRHCSVGSDNPPHRFCGSAKPSLQLPVLLRTAMSAPSLHLLSYRRGSVLLAAATLQENAAEINAGAKVVKVKFQLQKKCKFGQQFNVVGDDVNFGAWDPAAAIPMEWSEGHLWRTELDISVGKRVEFKMILTGKQGELEWQPGPNRVLEVSEASSSLLISESWSDEDILHQVPLAHKTDIKNSSDVQVCDALVISHVTIPCTVDGTADNATKASDTAEIITDHGRELTDKESQQRAESRMEQDSSKDPGPKLSVLEKDLNWGRRALSTFWWAFRQGRGDAQR